MSNETKSILGLIKSRRATRRFSDKPVSIEDITAVLEAAQWAPSGENVQPWKFLVIKNKETQEQIVELIPYKKFQLFLKNAPVLIVILVNKRKSAWAFVDGPLCVQNLMLEAWARGLGTCFSAWHPTVPKEVETEVRNLLSIPRRYNILTMTPLGYPDENPKRAHILPPKRYPLEDLVSYEIFSEPKKEK